MIQYKPYMKTKFHSNKTERKWHWKFTQLRSRRFELKVIKTINKGEVSGWRSMAVEQNQAEDRKLQAIIERKEIMMET